MAPLSLASAQNHIMHFMVLFCVLRNICTLLSNVVGLRQSEHFLVVVRRTVVCTLWSVTPTTQYRVERAEMKI